MTAVSIALVALGLYGAIGLLFGTAFVVRGVARVDPVAARAPWHVRLLFLPGSAALWPVMARKWARASPERAAGSEGTP
jgi:hypothetical protein